MLGSRDAVARIPESRFFYGWVVVAAGTVLMAVNSATFNSFGIFFKPLVADFGWSRAATSGVSSMMSVCLGLSSVAAGWFADRFGPARILVTCSFLAGLGLVLTSQVNALWQMYLTLSLMAGVGMSCNFVVTGTTAARWFIKRRGMALGLVASGSGLGTFIGAPLITSLIESVGWSKAYIIIGAVVCITMAAAAYFLRRKPEPIELRTYSPEALPTALKTGPSWVVKPPGSVSLLAAVGSKTFWILFGVFFFFSFATQMIMVHLVNHATDLGIAPLVAATLVGGVGLSSCAGRIVMGTASDRIGNINTLIVACLAAALGLVWLTFARELWMFYLFTVIYGFAFGAEIPQQTALIGKFFGLQAVLVAAVHGGANVGGAIGTWAGGYIFDVTHSYQVAFLIAAATVALALAGTIFLGRRK